MKCAFNLIGCSSLRVLRALEKNSRPGVKIIRKNRARDEDENYADLLLSLFLIKISFRAPKKTQGPGVFSPPLVRLVGATNIFLADQWNTYDHLVGFLDGVYGIEIIIIYGSVCLPSVMMNLLCTSCYLAWYRKIMQECAAENLNRDPEKLLFGLPFMCANFFNVESNWSWRLVICR